MTAEPVANLPSCFSCLPNSREWEHSPGMLAVPRYVPQNPKTQAADKNAFKSSKRASLGHATSDHPKPHPVKRCPPPSPSRWRAGWPLSHMDEQHLMGMAQCHQCPQKPACPCRHVLPGAGHVPARGQRERLPPCGQAGGFPSEGLSSPPAVMPGRDGPVGSHPSRTGRQQQLWHGLPSLWGAASQREANFRHCWRGHGCNCSTSLERHAEGTHVQGGRSWLPLQHGVQRGAARPFCKARTPPTQTKAKSSQLSSPCMKQEEDEHSPSPLQGGEGERPLPSCAVLLLAPGPLAQG